MKIKYFVISVLTFGLILSVRYAVSTPDHSLTEHNDKKPAGTVGTMTSARSTNHKIYNEASNTVAFLPEKPISIRDINHDVVLKTTAAGDLIVGKEVKELFEFYLSAIGEESLEQTLYRIQHELAEQLAQPALDQAKSLLKRYVDYKIELITLEIEVNSEISNGLSEVDRIRMQKTQLTELRNQYFNQSEYEPFFQQEETYDTYMLDHLVISQNNNLTDAERKQQLAILEHSLPQEIKDTRNRVSQHSNLYESANALRKKGATEEEIYQLRANALGDGPALAMAKLDANRAQWQQRLDNFASDKQQIERSGLSEEDQSVAINRLIESQFSGTEKIRVKAINRLL